MAYQTALTIKEALDGVYSHKYLLPAIQREFVWKPDQIEELFDSLMRGYPIGAFLFWEVAPENVDSYGFFEFITDYDERAPHNKPASVPAGHGVTAILDGQQRLSALNIALRGSHTSKLPRMHTSNPKAYPPRQLFLNLSGVNEDASPDEAKFDFRFVSKEELTDLEKDGGVWFPVKNVKDFDPAATDVFDYLHKRGHSGEKAAHATLHRLTQLIHVNEVISYYLEKSNDIDKVLNIFIRVNSGGTQLSYSDLLLSVATAKWSQRDARKEIHDLVDQINAVGQKFKFSKDRVLKASLLLGDFADIKFKAANFKLDNMLQIEKQWDSISDSLLISAQLLASFGLSSETLTAENVLIPVAYYIQHRNLDDSFLLSKNHAKDRSTIRLWVLKTLLRTGFWTGAVDTILITTRDMIREHGASGFPDVQIEEALKAKSGKSLAFEDEEIEDLLDTTYNKRRTVLLLTLLFPWIEMNQAYHQDHVFPQKLFRRSSLKQLGLQDDEIDALRRDMNRLANLHLLPGLVNQEKSGMLPSTWAEQHVADDKRQGYLDQYDLQNLPTDLSGFPEFYANRREVFRKRLASLLKKPDPST